MLGNHTSRRYFRGLRALRFAPSALARSLVPFKRFLERWVRAEMATYSGTLRTPEGVHPASAIRQNLAEATKQARNVFILHLTVTSYALLTLAGIRDSDFYGPRATIKLPAVDLQVPVGTFFVSMPLLALLVGVYLQVYLGQLYRLRRRLAQAGGGSPSDPDLAYPWLASMAQLGGPFGALVRLSYNLLVWWLCPLLLLLYWARLLVLRSSLWNWLAPDGNGLPAASAVAVLAVIAVVLFCIWSAARRIMDHKFGLAGAPGPAAVTVRLVLVAATVIPIASQDCWVRFWRAPNLRLAVLSDPAREGLTAAIGANLQNARLDGADLTGAYLENANLEGASLIGANVTRANLTGAILRSATLRSAVGGDVRLENADLRGADLQRVTFPRARAQGSDLQEADLRGAILDNADLRSTRISRAHIEGAWLWGARIEEAFLQGAYLDGAILEGASLRSTDLTGSCLTGVNFRNTDLTAARLAEASLSGADLTGAELNSVVLLPPAVSVVDERSKSEGGCSIEPATAWVCGQAPAGSGYQVAAESSTCKALADAALGQRAQYSEHVRQMLSDPPPSLRITVVKSGIRD